jgi:hypothetical protein
VLLAQAARAKLAETTKVNLNAKLKHVPPVQRPGIHVGRKSADSVDAAQAAFDRVSKSGSTRDQITAAAALSEARARAREQARNANGTWR